MDFIAHTENSSGDCHKLADHLSAVGELAAKFAAQMNPELVEPACWAGLLHDLGAQISSASPPIIGLSGQMSLLARISL